MRLIRTIKSARLTGLPVQRCTFECACGLGTDEREEFEAHLARCPMVFDSVRALVQRRLAQGLPVAMVPPAPPAEREGQLEIPGLPPETGRRRRRR